MNSRAEFIRTATEVRGDQLLAARAALRLQAAILLANTQLFMLGLFIGGEVKSWMLASAFALMNCGVGLFLLRPHYAEYLRLRGLLIDAESSLDVVVTPRRLNMFDAAVGGGLLLGATTLYLIIDAYTLIQHYLRSV
jgi:hypothetical protein